MVTRITLSDIFPHTQALLSTAANKILASKFTKLNEDLDKNLEVDMNVITVLLNTIEARIRKAEMLYHTFLQSADHGTLSGASSALPIILEFEFSFGTSIISETIDINDRKACKEIVDLNFQQFIFQIASILENCVRLTEILVKKVILHLPKRGPLSTPMLSYISFFELLMKLGYRKPDHLSSCLTTHDQFLKLILEPVNNLRNAFIHGFQAHLESDGSNYRIDQRTAKTFSTGSPDLNIDAFCRIIITGLIPFVSDLLDSLSKQIKYYKKTIPA